MRVLNVYPESPHFDFEVLCICSYIYLYFSSWYILTRQRTFFLHVTALLIVIPPHPILLCFSFYPAMATVWLRHPRYSFLILFTLLTTFYLLFIPHHGPIQSFHVQDDSLKTRVERAHTIYDKFLVQRAGLLKKWGPEPKDISVYVFLLFSLLLWRPFSWYVDVQSFPADKAPWPAYTVCKLYYIFINSYFSPFLLQLTDTCISYQGISLLRHSTAHMKLNVTAL